MARHWFTLCFLLLGCAWRDGAPSPVVSAPARWEAPRLDAERRAKFDKLVPELDQMFAEDQRNSGAPGIAVGIVLGGETVYAKGFGLRDVAQNKPFAPDTPFPIASVTKSFTAMAILKLRDEGKLELDVPAARYYPPLAKIAYPTRDAPPITLRHLLTHSSGMPEDNPYVDVTENLTEAQLADLLNRGVMSRAPGVEFEYANFGYAVLGQVIARVSGVPTREYFRRAIFEPLGMAETGWGPEDFAAGTVAVGYRGREGSDDLATPAVVAPAERLGVMDAGGGLYTTLRGLSRYMGYHVTAWPPRDDVESGPLRRSSVREMQEGARRASFNEFLSVLVQRAPRPLAGVGAKGLALQVFSYGFGLQTRVTCDREVFVEHSGGLPGYETFLTMVPEAGVGVIVFLNDERADSKAIQSTLKLMRAAGLLEKPSISPLPGLVDARTQVLELMSSWTDAKAQALFEPSFFRYQTIETLKEKFATLQRDHGSCRFDGHDVIVNPLRGNFRATCERGAIHFAAALAPGPRPRLQGLKLREEMPPSQELEGAAAAMVKLLERWDTAAATQSLASPSDVTSLERAFAKLNAVHGACKIDRAVDGDGKTSATFLLACEGGPLELAIQLERSGKIAGASGRAPRSETRPNCVD